MILPHGDQPTQKPLVDFEDFSFPYCILVQSTRAHSSTLMLFISFYEEKKKWKIGNDT